MLSRRRIVMYNFHSWFGEGSDWSLDSTNFPALLVLALTGACWNSDSCGRETGTGQALFEEFGRNYRLMFILSNRPMMGSDGLTMMVAHGDSPLWSIQHGGGSWRATTTRGGNEGVHGARGNTVT
ncbi:hypothetical protein Dimus_010756 [Dionaea muscipula]